MNLLLDTHALIWWMEGSKRLGRKAKAEIFRDGNALWISTASVWEMSIKSCLGRLQLKLPLEESIPALTQQGVRSLPVSIEHALAVQNLPLHHRDPFDRMLVVQAQCEDLVLVTADPAILSYEVRTLDAGH